MTEDVLDLRTIIDKLGHHLYEIRRRSLDNIKSKLRNEIIQCEDLIHHHDLFVHLMQCLNQGDNPKEIVELLADLSKFPTTCGTLLELGAVNFFTSFRQELHADDDGLVNGVDQILEHLFYVHDESISIDTSPLVHRPAKQDSSSNENANKSLGDILRKYDNHKLNATQALKQPTQVDCVTTEDKLEKGNCFNGSSRNSKQQFVFKDSFDYPMEAAEPQSHVFDNFQWIALTSGDRQILAVTDNRLQSPSFDLIIQSCEFLKGVLFHDFPAEVFIQRPNIVKTLLAVITLYKEKWHVVVEHAVTCLTDLCERLHKRLLQSQNLDLWQQRQVSEDIQSLSVSTNPTESMSLSSSPTPSSKIHPMEQVDSGSSKNADNLRVDDDFESDTITDALLSSQMSLEDFLLNILTSTVELLQLYMEENNFFCLIVHLHKTVFRLLKLQNLKAKWETPAPGDKKLIYTLMVILHKLGDVVKPFTDHNRMTSQRMELKAILICQLVTSILIATVPEDRLYEAVNEQLVAFFWVVIVKVSSLKSLPSFKTTLENIISKVDEKFYGVYTKAVALVKSMKCIDQFQTFQSGKSSMQDEEIVKLLQAIFSSSFLHCHKEVIKASIHLCCQKYRKSEEKKKWLDLLLALMKTGHESALEVAYTQCLELLKVYLSVSLVCEPLSLLHQEAKLFLEHVVLQEMICHGLHHRNLKISNVVKSIIALLLLSRLHMVPSYWKQFVCNVTTLLPIIQSCLVSSEAAFDKSILSLVNSPQLILNVEGEICGLTVLEQLKFCMRLMLLKSAKMRGMGLGLVLVVLTERSKQTENMMRFSHSGSAKYEDVLFLNSQSYFNLHGADMSFDTSLANVSLDNVNKLWDVFTDRSVDEQLRSSAAEQLAIIFQDSNMQRSVVESEKLNHIIESFKLIVKTINEKKVVSTFMKETQEPYLLSLLKMVRCIVHHQSSIRQILSLQFDMYVNLFQTCLLCIDHEAIRLEANCILCYFLFDDVLTWNYGEKKYSLHKSILKSYKIPAPFEKLSDEIRDTSVIEDEKLFHQYELLAFIKQSCLLTCDWFKSDNFLSCCSNSLHYHVEELNQANEYQITNVIKSITQGLSGSTDHYVAIRYLAEIKLLLMIDSSGLLEDESKALLVNALDESCKKGFVNRVLSVRPRTEDDHKVFQATISMLHCAIQMDKYGGVDFHEALVSQHMIQFIEEPLNDGETLLVKKAR